MMTFWKFLKCDPSYHLVLILCVSVYVSSVSSSVVTMCNLEEMSK